MHRIVYLPCAEDDIIGAANYIVSVLESPSAAEALLNEIDKTVLRLAEFPYSCELYRASRPVKDEIRKVRVKNYVLYYAVFQDTVEIRRFLHGRRDRSKGVIY